MVDSFQLTFTAKVGNVVLYFSTLASAFTLKRALPPYLPPAEQARQRLVDAIRQLEVVKKREVQQSHHLLYFAYALMMSEWHLRWAALGIH